MKVFFNPSTAPETLYPIIPALLIRGRDVAIWNPEITDAFDQYLRRDIITELMDIYDGETFSIGCSEDYSERIRREKGKYAGVFSERIDHSAIRTSEDVSFVSKLSYDCWQALEGKRFVLEGLLDDFMHDMKREKASREQLKRWEKVAQDNFGGSMHCAAFSSCVQDLHMIAMTKSNSPNVKIERWDAYLESIKALQLYFEQDDGNISDEGAIIAHRSLNDRELNRITEYLSVWAEDHGEEINYIEAKHAEYINLCCRINDISTSELRRSISDLKEFSQQFRSVEKFVARTALGNGMKLDKKIPYATAHIRKRFEAIREKDCKAVRSVFWWGGSVLALYHVYEGFHDPESPQNWLVAIGDLILARLGVEATGYSLQRFGDRWTKWRLTRSLGEVGAGEVVGVVMSNSEFWKEF